MFTHLNEIGITNQMITSLFITILLGILAFLATRNMKLIPSGLQNFAEWAVETMQNFFAGVMGEHLVRKYLPFIATFFIYIMFCNYSGLLPLAGKIPGLAAPTSTINFPAGMAIVAFLGIQIVAIKEHKSIIKAYRDLLFKPVAIIFPLMFIEMFVKPLSLTLRLYGNVFGDETVTHELTTLFPLIAPVVMQILGVLMGLVQALVFALLCATYWTEAAECEEEEKLLHANLS